MTTLKYNLKYSPLYNLQNKKKLKELLYINNEQFNYFSKEINLNKEYSPFTNKKGRLIDNPSAKLKKLQFRLYQLLSRIKYPEYLYSAKKRSTYKNAKRHKNNNYMLKMDISKFFPSSNKEYIFRAFKYNFKMSDDIAWWLANLVCYKNHLATGSPVSVILSFWGYKNVFDTIYILAKNRCITMSLYVDDMAFSSNKRIPIAFKNKVKKYLKNVDLALSEKPNKTCFYGKNESKKITGIIITTDKQLKITAEKEEVINDMLKNLPNLKEKQFKSLLGMLRYKKKIEEQNSKDLTEIINKVNNIKNKKLA